MNSGNGPGSKRQETEKMTINEIYETYTIGSTGFVKAVATYCNLEISDSEIETISTKATTAAEFMNIWENEAWWVDAE